MKTIQNTTALLIFLLFISASLQAQEKGNGNVIRQGREVAAFDAINVGCAINLFLSQGDKQSVSVEIDENLQSKLRTKVDDGELTLSCDNVRNATKMNVYVTATDLKKLDANGAAVVKGVTPIAGDHFTLVASGASKVNMEINATTLSNEASGASQANLIVRAEEVSSEITGAAELGLSGSANLHKMEVTGAGKIKALEFVTDESEAEISGAGNASIMARKQLNAELSGAGSITYFDNNELKKIGKSGEYTLMFSGMDNVKSVIIEDEEDRNMKDQEKSGVVREDEDGNVEVVINDKKIVVVTDDSVRVKLGDNSIEINEDGNVKIKKGRKKEKFNGHWKGLDLGVNGYLTPNNDFSYPDEYSLLDQNYQKSINVNLNFYEQNVNLIRNKLGLITGLGITWNNYRFDNDVRLEKGENKLELHRDKTEGVTYEKSKLVNTYLTLPLMLEVQTNRHSKVNSFHIGAGVLSGWRIGTHTKYVFDDGSRQKDKDRSDFFMNPFKLDAIATIGWGVINLYATYSLTPMFQKNKGPELYPFSVGICLTDLTDL